MAKHAKDFTDPMYLNFICENYEKEAYLRARWNITHGDLARKAAKQRHGATNYTPQDIYKSIMVAGMPNTIRDNITAARNRVTKRVKDYVFIKDRATEPPEPPMYPIEEEVKAIIKESREEYLKVRNAKAPEDKYKCIETVNMRYGWELTKNAIKPSKAVHGRTCPLTNLIRDQHSGPHRDPDHYKMPDNYRHACYL